MTDVITPHFEDDELIGVEVTFENVDIHEFEIRENVEEGEIFTLGEPPVDCFVVPPEYTPWDEDVLVDVDLYGPPTEDDEL